MNKKEKRLYTIPIFGFMSIILIGAIILTLPICNNKPIAFIDSLFISTSGVCVTGYTPLVLSEQLTWIGQFVLLLLVQIGALGFMTFIIFIATIIKKRINFSDIMLVEDGEVNADFKNRIKNIVIYTFLIELIGGTLLSLRFIPQYGWKKGLWYGIFHSVMAFCNAGFDILGNKSFSDYTNDYFVNFVMMFLIILGGIGFLVLEDLTKALKLKTLKKLKFQSKIVLSATGIILVVSVLLFKALEPDITWLQAMFSSVTLRTAGFYTINFAECNQATKMISIILMFIGGAPGSTAGGIRVVTFSVLMLSIIATLKNRRKVVVFYRRIPENTIMKAITITGLSLFVVFVGTINISFFNDVGLENIIFHCVGSYSNTGLGIIDSSMLNFFGKITIIILMFIGRVGPLVAFRVFFDTKETNNSVKYINGELIL